MSFLWYNGHIMKDIKKDFPFFKNNPGLIYGDNAATTQKPQVVIDRMSRFYTHENAPVHRGVYALAEQATTAYEAVRAQVKDFIGACDRSEIVFTPNATAGINLVARAWAQNVLKPGDEIVLTELEHHANLVPWLQVAQATGARVRYIPLLSNGNLDYAALPEIINENTKIVAMTALSNVTGLVVDVEKIAAAAKKVGAACVVDACQSILRSKIDVEASKIDFLVFSSHKALGPAGAGVLFARRKFHPQMTPLFGGGGAVLGVDFESMTWRSVPERYEAGTPDVQAVLGLGAALEYITKRLDRQVWKKYEEGLRETLVQGLRSMPRIKILGPIDPSIPTGGIVSFTVDGIHAHDVAAFFDKHNIAVRSGNHCAQPLHSKFGIAATVRISFCIYNSHEDVKRILETMRLLLNEH